MPQLPDPAPYLIDIMAGLTAEEAASHATLAAGAAAFRGDPPSPQPQGRVQEVDDSEDSWEDGPDLQQPPSAVAPSRCFDSIQQIADIYDCSRAMAIFATDQCARSGSGDMMFTWLDLVTSAQRPDEPFVGECADLEAIRRFFVLHDLFDRRKRNAEDGIHKTLGTGWLAVRSIGSIRSLSREHEQLSAAWLRSLLYEPPATLIDETNLISLAKYLWMVDAGATETELSIILSRAPSPSELTRRGLPLGTAKTRMPPEGPVFEDYFKAIRGRWDSSQLAAALAASTKNIPPPATPPAAPAAEGQSEFGQPLSDARHVHNWRRGHALVDDSLFVAFFSDAHDAHRRGGRLVAAAWTEVSEAAVRGPHPAPAAAWAQEPRRAVPYLSSGHPRHSRDTRLDVPRAIRMMHRDPQEPLTSRLCSAFNSQSGCTRMQSDCPLGLLHLCDTRRPDGSICGSWQHSRNLCGESFRVSRQLENRTHKSIRSHLEALEPGEDSYLVLQWCLSIGLETVMDIAGLQESELLDLCPDHLKAKVPPIHPWACRLKNDSLQSRATALCLP